jgi:prepilin-type N-terminal cleavage/methylation domain-containing protein
MLINFNGQSKLENSAGFTLLEVLIAILILAFISLSAYKMIDENTTAKDKITTEDRDYMQTLTALTRIESDFNEFYTPLFSDSRVLPGTPGAPYQDTATTYNGNFEGNTKNGIPIPLVSSEDKSSLIFLTTVNRRRIAGSKESNFVWVKYFLKPTEAEEEKKQGGYDLIRQSISLDPFRPTPNWSDVREQLILSNLKSFEFQYYDERSKRYVGSLSDLNENKNLLRSIKVIFIWINEDKNEFKFEKNFRVLTPYFNTKQDDLKAAGGSWGDSQVPPGVPTNPNDSTGGNDGIQY